MAHTPAPWTIEEYGDDETPNLVIHKDSETRICFMATPGSHGDPAIIEANAHLIAAAPEMFALLKRMATSYQGYIPDFVEAVHSVIDKAEPHHAARTRD